VKFLAEFAMRGRAQALLVTLISASSLMFCWIGAAVVALVTLRRGPAQGAWLLLWALLPAAAVLVYWGDSGPLAMLVGTAILAALLRATMSLPLVMVTSVAIGGVTGLLSLVLAGEQLELLVAFFTQWLGQLEQEMAAGGAEQALRLQPPTISQVAGMLGLVNAVSCILCLLLARYWQASLYNPGGFGQEFRRLYLPPVVSSLLLLLSLGISALDATYRSWAAIFLVPLAFAGLALVHAYAAWRGKGSGWMSVFYGLWLLLDPVKLMVVFAAVGDSWFRFRDRWTPAVQDEEDL
jgi:hypothetical protein